MNAACNTGSRKKLYIDYLFPDPQCNPNSTVDRVGLRRIGMQIDLLHDILIKGNTSRFTRVFVSIASIRVAVRVFSKNNCQKKNNKKKSHFNNNIPRLEKLEKMEMMIKPRE